MSQKSSATVRVRYSETDQMGVAYHAHYLVWCEIGRTELIRSLGTPYAELERVGVRLAVVDAAVRYAAAAYYDDLLRIDTRVENVRSRTVDFAYEISRVEPDCSVRLATASTTLLAIDEAGKPRSLPTAVRRGLEATG